MAKYLKNIYTYLEKNADYVAKLANYLIKYISKYYDISKNIY